MSFRESEDEDVSSYPGPSRGRESGSSPGPSSSASSRRPLRVSGQRRRRRETFRTNDNDDRHRDNDTLRTNPGSHVCVSKPRSDYTRDEGDPPERNLGYAPEMASDDVFHMYPDPGDVPRGEVPSRSNGNERFIQKQYPTLYMSLSGREHPYIEDVRIQEKRALCPLCNLDKNTLDSIKVLKPNEVKGYLDMYDHRFTEEQVNVHLAHSVRDENVIGVIQNMTVDLISKSYAMANEASLGVMNRVITHMGRPVCVTDQDVAKVHSDAVKQFICLASTCQALMKFKSSDTDKPSGGSSSLL